MQDLRALLDPLAAVRRARPRVRRVPPGSRTPRPTQAVPDPGAVPTPARTEVYTDPAELPAELVTAAGGVDLGGQVALLLAAVAQLADEVDELRSDPAPRPRPPR